MYLLDTDHCIFLMRRHETICQEFERRSDEGAYVSMITVAELLFGAYWSARPEENKTEIDRLLELLSVLPLTRSVVDRFARIKANLLRAGRKLEDPDLFIAATALEHGLVLVTHNTAHYERIDELHLEDWHD